MLTHEHFIRICMILSTASYCKRKQVGCIIVKDGNIISQSYNGMPSGFDNNCEDQKGETKDEVLHAESNAITKMAKSTISCEGASLYVTLSPCLNCAKLILQSGIKRLYYLNDHSNPDGIALLIKAKVHVEKIIL